MGQKQPDQARIVKLCSVSLLVLIPSLFWMITGQVWEDFLITFRQAANLVQGNGLTYHAGELLHSFTSPLNVLVPALMAWLTTPTEFGTALFLYNLVSIACLAGGGLLVVKLLLSSEGTPRSYWPVLLFPLLLVLSVRVTSYSVNGQEAGFWVLFLAITMRASFKGISSSWLLAGLGWGGLMWTRPDSPVHVTLFALAALILPLHSRKSEMIGILKAAMICTIVYLPWFIWAWWYYGTPVPHTVMAKSGAYGGFLSENYALFQWIQISMEFLGAPFLPIYFLPQDWPPVVAPFFAAVSIFIILSPILFKDRLIRLSGFLYFGSLLYLEFMELTARSFPWYYVPPVFFGCLCLARIVSSLQNRQVPGYFRKLWQAGVALLLVFSAGAFAGSVRQIEFQQRVIENGVRRPVGLYLKENKKPEDRVYLEPLGYIGYYSGARMLDFPGLVSMETVEARAEFGTGFLDTPRHLEPEWIVLRPHEAEAMRKRHQILDNYHLDAVIDQRETVLSEPWLPGRGYPFTDSAFFIYKRKMDSGGEVKDPR